jgi:hypothetical protein
VRARAMALVTTRRCDRVMLYVMYLCHKMIILYCCEDYGLVLLYIHLELQLSLFCSLKLLYVRCFGGSPSGMTAKIGVI